jgi:N-acetylmuramoyl-L-alanine amidase
MTRTGNQTLSNADRYAYANATGAEVLVSIHMNGSSDLGTDYTTTLFGKWRKDKEPAHAVYGGLSVLPAADGAGAISSRTPYSFASGVLLKSAIPTTIAGTLFITGNAETRLLSDRTGASSR